MANCILAFPNFVAADPAFVTVGIDGGAWVDDLPLSNLLRPEFAYVARSIDLALQSTRFVVDLGQVRDVRGVFIPKTNGSTLCKYRIRAYGGDGTGGTPSPGIGFFAIGIDAIESEPFVDTGWLDLYRPIYPPGSLYWGSPSLWDGKLAPEDASLYPMPVVELFDEAITVRYWTIEFDDTENDAGYFELPQVILSGGWQPRINMSWGTSLVVEDPSIEQEAIGGGLYFAQRPKRRVARFTLGFLGNNEALVQVSDMQRRLGVQGQLFFVSDPDDRSNMHRTAFLARMRSLSPLERISHDINTAPFDLQEIVA